MNENTKNISKWFIDDAFKCEKCGIEIANYVKLAEDVDGDLAGIEYYAIDDKITHDYTEGGKKTIWAYSPKYCPECGRKIIEK